MVHVYALLARAFKTSPAGGGGGGVGGASAVCSPRGPWGGGGGGGGLVFLEGPGEKGIYMYH
jgi:hypothetical protein